MNRIARSLTLLLVVASLGADKPLIDDYVKASVGPIPSDLTLDAFYKKHADALGIPVVSSEKVPDAALLVARDIVIHMLAKRPDLREAMVGRKMRVIVMARSESTTDLPEQKDWKKPGRDDRRLTSDGASTTRNESADSRTRSTGTGARHGGQPDLLREENLLGYPGTRYFGENIFVHEFAHGIMDIGIRRADPELFRKIGDAYKAAMDKGLWKGHYASTNANEYWAEGTQTWFWSNYEYKDGETTVMTPDDLKGYDPTLYDLLSQVYADHHIPLDVYHAKGLHRAAEATC